MWWIQCHSTRWSFLRKIKVSYMSWIFNKNICIVEESNGERRNRCGKFTLKLLVHKLYPIWLYQLSYCISNNLFIRIYFWNPNEILTAQETNVKLLSSSVLIQFLTATGLFQKNCTTYFVNPCNFHILLFSIPLEIPCPSSTPLPCIFSVIAHLFMLWSRKFVLHINFIQFHSSYVKNWSSKIYLWDTHFTIKVLFCCSNFC